MKYLLIILALFTLSGCGEPAEWKLETIHKYDRNISTVSMDIEDYRLTIGCSGSTPVAGLHKITEGEVMDTMFMKPEYVQKILYTLYQEGSDMDFGEGTAFPVSNFKVQWDSAVQHCLK